MTRDRPTILITGFGPFPGQPENASSLLADGLAKAAGRRLPGYRLVAETLPTEWKAGPVRLAELLEALQPSLAVHFGVSRRASGFVVETRARNVRSITPDACGVEPEHPCVLPDGPDEMRATLPTSQIAESLRRLAIPVQLSRDAGGYLCNAVLYHSLSEARGHAGHIGPRRGFIHIPDRLAGPDDGNPGLAVSNRRLARPSRLSWEQAIAGGLEILAVSAGVRSAGNLSVAHSAQLADPERQAALRT